MSAAAPSGSYDVVVVGAGAVGCAVARQVLKMRLSRAGGGATGRRSLSCLVVEKNEDVLSEASSGNTGHLATNFYYSAELDSRGAPLEAELTGLARRRRREWLAQQPNVPWRRAGLLYVARNDDEMSCLRDMLRIGLKNEVDVRELTPEEIREREPEMDTGDIVGGILSEEEYVVDSFLLPLSNLYEALERGCELRTGCQVTAMKFEQGAGWEVSVKSDDDGGVIHAKSVVNCAGNYSDDVRRMIGGGKAGEFDIRPARGEYLVVRSGGIESGRVGSMVVTAPGQKSAGPYVFESAYGDLVVGPTHQTQESKTDKSNRRQELENLLAHGKNLFPKLFSDVDLDDVDSVRSFCGLRPASIHHRDYQIEIDRERSFASAGAIRSTGLTASRAIAEHLCRGLFGDFEDDPHSGTKHSMPPVERDVGREGFVRAGSHIFRVTHPLSRMGILD